MEIDGKNPLAGLNSSIQRLDVGQQPIQRARKSGDEIPKADTDRIEFSVQSRDVQHLDELIRSTPDVREYKVEQVRNALENGTHNVKAEQVADKMLNGSLIDRIF